MRRQIGYVIGMLKEGNTLTLVAYGFQVEKAVRIAEIVKLRIGMLHQET